MDWKEFSSKERSGIFIVIHPDNERWVGYLSYDPCQTSVVPYGECFVWGNFKGDDPEGVDDHEKGYFIKSHYFEVDNQELNNILMKVSDEVDREESWTEEDNKLKDHRMEIPERNAVLESKDGVLHIKGEVHGGDITRFYEEAGGSDNTRLRGMEIGEKTIRAQLGETLFNEDGGGSKGFGFVCIWRDKEDPLDDGSYHARKCSVGEFLSRPENQKGTWFIDGGWGGPPGAIHVRWNEETGEWENGGFGGRSFPE